MAEEQYERVWAKGNPLFSIVALIHPTAVLIFGLSVFGLALLAMREVAGMGVALVLMSAMMLAQAGIGVLNDVFDYDLDRSVKPWRALPAGHISRRSAATVALLLIMVGGCIASRVSLTCVLLLISGVGVGVLYSTKLKRTGYSWTAYAIAYPSLPVWVWVSLERFQLVQLWIYILALPLVVGVHMVNQMRDFEADHAQGTRGFVQHLGKGRAIKICHQLLWVSPVPFLVFGLIQDPLRFSLIASASILHWGLLGSVIPRSGKEPGREEYRRLFRRLQLSGPVLLAAWVVGI